MPPDRTGNIRAASSSAVPAFASTSLGMAMDGVRRVCRFLHTNFWTPTCRGLAPRVRGDKLAPAEAGAGTATDAVVNRGAKQVFTDAVQLFWGSKKNDWAKPQTWTCDPPPADCCYRRLYLTFAWAASVWVLSPVYADAGRCRSDTPSLVVQPSTSAVAASNTCQGSGLVVGKLKNLVKTRCGKDAFDLPGSAVQNKPTPTIDQ